MHFMNPVPVMQLVEVAKGVHTSQQTFESCKGLAEFLGKQVCTSQDRPVSRVTRVTRVAAGRGVADSITAWVAQCHGAVWRAALVPVPRALKRPKTNLQGFLVNRVLIPMINEAFFCLMEVRRARGT